MDVFVIGGGASGLTAAITAARGKAKVTVLEKNSKCGKKLLLTGNSRCNFWNEKMDSSFYHSTDYELIDKILTNNPKRGLDFITSLGIVPKVINGYYYPYSNQAISIVNALVKTSLKLKVNIKYEEEVIKIVKKEKFLIYTSKSIYQADKVIIATGGMSYPKTGSDGKGYQLATSFGHTIIKPLPALVQLRCQESFYKDLKGVRTEAYLTLYENQKLRKKELGEVLFTDYGLSGICTFNLSEEVARGLNKNQEEIIMIDFVPWFLKSDQEFTNWLFKQNAFLKNNTIGEILEGFLNYKIVNVILKLGKLNFADKLTENNIKILVELLRHFKTRVIGTNSFNEAEVTSGGIPLKEINLEKMESLKIKDLYFCGEILDVSGICGGYNLGFAWTSGILAGEGVLKDD